MRSIIKSLVVASTLVAAGSAFAQGSQVETNVLAFATKGTITHSGSAPRADDIVTNSIRSRATAPVSDQSYSNSGR